jgi:hypothetical protein
MRDYAKLKSSLRDDLGNLDNMLTSDMSLEAAQRLWLSNSFWKKFQDDLEPDCDRKCLALFLESNDRCRSFNLEPKTLFEEVVINEVKTLFDNYFFCGPDQSYTLSDVFDGCGTGPGASVGVDSYNFYTKMFDSTLSGTSERLYRYYRYAIMDNPTWLSAEKAREERYGHLIVGGNRLSFVPKTSEVSRSICTEPVLNMFLQKGIGSVFEKILWRRYRIDFSTQPDLNKQLAREGSLSGRFGTIDLSSASDSIALSMLKEILPSYVFDWLTLARSPTVTYPDGGVSELYMVSSMGNGFTFPLQSLLFATIVAAVYRLVGIKLSFRNGQPENFGIFGDDIIVEKQCYHLTIRALELFGFSVNDQKSFLYGSFRESCGGDFYRGHDIRGVYIKSLKHDADVYSAINRLVRWSVRSGVLLPKTIQLLNSWVEFRPIPFEAGDAEGIKVPEPPHSLPRSKYTGGVFYYPLVKLGKSIRAPLDPSKAGFYRKHKLRREIFYNANGLLVAFLGGFIRNGRIALRPEVDRFKVRRRVTSTWRSYTAGNFSLGDGWVTVSEFYSLWNKPPA